MEAWTEDRLEHRSDLSPSSALTLKEETFEGVDFSGLGPVHLTSETCTFIGCNFDKVTFDEFISGVGMPHNRYLDVSSGTGPPMSRGLTGGRG